jgi:hypothetical protein
MVETLKGREIQNESQLVSRTFVLLLQRFDQNLTPQLQIELGNLRTSLDNYSKAIDLFNKSVTPDRQIDKFDEEGIQLLFDQELVNLVGSIGDNPTALKEAPATALYNLSQQFNDNTIKLESQIRQ